MNSVVGVTASFGQSETLSVTEAGSGSGVVTSQPAGINCSRSSTQCSASFGSGTAVTLTASASAGSAFAGWSGGGCSGTASCQVTLSGATSVTANFNAVSVTKALSVSESGNGTGTVTSTPSGIACGGTCTANFQQGTQVTLSAAASSGSTFVGWSGGGCFGNQSCTVTLNADTTVNANFVQISSTNILLGAAVLPASRSVRVGTTATAFATIIDAGPADASLCSLSPATSIPASFDFQTTDPATNAVTGTANTPVNIPQGAAQSFVFGLTPTAPFGPTDVTLTFSCVNAAPAQTILGVNTLNLSASASAVPDVVALAGSADPGYVDISPANNAGAFVVATVNLGSAATITASADTGSANLPVALTICQTDPSSGSCVLPAVPVASSVTTTIGANATPTFAIFAAGSGAVPDMPGVNRVFVRFTDAGGVLRGETSVAVRTR
jgi:hypothetical protein